MRRSHRGCPRASLLVAHALALLVITGPATRVAAEQLYGSLQLGSLAREEASVRGVVPLWTIPPPPTAQHTLVPIDELLLIASGTPDVPISAGSSQVLLRLSELGAGPIVTAVSQGGRILVENDLDRPRQVRLLGTRTPTIVDAGARVEVFAGSADAVGSLVIEAQETPWRAYVVVTEGPFAVGRLAYDDEGRVRIRFGDAVAAGAADSGEVRVAVWYRGRPVCRIPDSVSCEVAVPGRRTEHGWGLVPIGLSRAALFAAPEP